MKSPRSGNCFERVEVAGCLIGVDALHTQKDTGQQIVMEAGADYLLTVKANQQELRNPLAKQLPPSEQLFPPPEPLPPNWARIGPEKNRGRIGKRTFCAAPITPEQACFPAAAQCALILREVLGDKPDTQYLISSREPETLTPAQWLEVQRAHWGIETGLHQRLDVSANED